ncbi:hypothetical protein ZWY2020_038750 [Hordeum vulgare]|nr:hypothetical protein ZWY2020_038750 [Hordeum vulgare]
MFTPGSSFMYSNSPLKPFKINYVEPEIRVATPLNDPGLLKLMEYYEAECRRNEFEVENRKKYEHFCPTEVLQQWNYLQFQQVIFSSPVQVEFYKTMTAALPVLDSRYDTGVFILQILKTYRGMGVLGFTSVDLQALREIFLYEIATYNNSEVQLPIVTTFLQNHFPYHAGKIVLIKIYHSV